MENRQIIITSINDQRIEIGGEKAFMPLAEYLREEKCLTGTKVVCAEGDCGACTVLLASSTGPDGKLVFKSVNSCILPLYLIDGAQVVTVEGLKQKESELHPVQKAMVDCHGAQCGYCTPGFICAMAGMAEKLKSEKKEITEKKAKNFLTGNLCRCTGYKPILEASMSLDLKNTELLKDRYHKPAWLLEMKAIKNHSVTMNFNQKSIFLPVTMEEALKAKAIDSELRIVGGSTDIGVVVNKGRMTTPKAMALYHIDELKKITHDDHFITVGATATLSEFEDYVEDFIPELSRLIHLFASPQIKNQATLIGNVINGSPIADTIPFLMVSEAEVVLKRFNGTALVSRQVKMSEFYLGYKKIDMKADEIVAAIQIPRLKKTESLRLYKVSMRKDLDISAVTFAGLIEVDQGKIISARFALGGVAATVIRLQSLEAQLTGKDFTKESFKHAGLLLPSLISPLSDLRASKEYRMKVAQNFFLKFHNEISKGVLS